MKSLITVFVVASALLAAVRWSGQSIGAGSVFAIVVASFLAALFVRDYRALPGPARVPKLAPVQPRLPVRVVARELVGRRGRAVRTTARFARSTGAVSVGS